jgi:REP element-mobilizing transposase RayT
MEHTPKIDYRSRLPHLTPVGATFFVTFRLADALPRHIVNQLKFQMDKTIEELRKEKPKNYRQLIQDERKRFLGKYDYQLDNKPYGSCILQQPEIAAIVKEQLHRFDDELYKLICYCIMPNHVHILIDTSIQVTEYKMIKGELLPFWMDELPESFQELYKIMKRIKGASAYYCNKALNKTGTFWQKDSFDHFVRDEKEWHNIVQYILNNPVKAGLVKDWKNWKNTHVPSNLFDR